MPGTWAPKSLADTRSGHVLNWALLLVRRRRVAAARDLLEQALTADPALAYAYAVSALLDTLDKRWAEALRAGLAAREGGAETFAGATDLCIVSAQLMLGVAPDALDPVFDWSAFYPADRCEVTELPTVQGSPFPSVASDDVCYVICCDTHYLMEHAIALVCSIREKCRAAAVHLHVFSPGEMVWPVIDKLRAAVTPLPLSVTWESVDFAKYGGTAAYCSSARFARLYQFLGATASRLVMLDADSLVRADLQAELSEYPEIGLVYAEHEPPWHQYLAGLTAFRKTPESMQFLRQLSTFVVTNLETRQPRFYTDQIGICACVLRANAALTQQIGHLPLAKFCDTLFGLDALVWSITQKKTDRNAFSAYKLKMLARYGFAQQHDESGGRSLQ